MSARPSAGRPAYPAAGNVVVVSGSVGAGHDGVARELAARLDALGHDVDVVDLLAGFSRSVAALLGSAYLFTLRVAPWLYELTCWLVERSRTFQRVADAICCSANGWLLERVRGADLVVATYPPAARALGRLREQGLLDAPAVTYLTDPAPNFLWVHPAVDLHLSPSRATAEEAEQRYGVPVVPAGPLVDPRYRGQDRAAARRHLRQVAGVGPHARVALVLLGSLGVGDVRPAVRSLRAAGLVPVVLCGRNERLRAGLERSSDAVALGWRLDTPALVAGADLVVHNAGGLALTETLVAGVPCVTFAALPGHGRANARTLERAGTVPWARSARRLQELAGAARTTTVRPWPVAEETAVQHISALLPCAADSSAQPA